MSDCIFCKIINHEIPSTVVYEDDQILAFNDITPKAPVHILIIPKKHLATIMDFQEEDKDLLGHINLVAAKLAKEKGIAESGFRLVNNCNSDGGQEVYHVHYHLIGGEKLNIFA